MDYAELKNLLSLFFMAAAIIGVGWWAFSPKRKARFKDAANLPFADDEQIAGQKKAEPKSRGEQE